MSVSKALRAAVHALNTAGIEEAATDARALLAEAMEVPRERLALHLDERLSAEAGARLSGMLARRLRREPVARILGRRHFWGRDFAITDEVLDPRPETECLIAAALDGPAPARFLDMGTGSGCIAVTLLAEWHGTRAVASDLSATALAVAGENAVRHGVADRLMLLQSDWFTDVTARYDLIVSNPPYIAEAEMAALAPEVLNHDPRGALSDGGDGLSAYRALAVGAPRHLVPGGRILVEIGWRQGRAVADLFLNAGFGNVRILPDLDGRDRIVEALLP